MSSKDNSSSTAEFIKKLHTKPYHEFYDKAITSYTACLIDNLDKEILKINEQSHINISVIIFSTNVVFMVTHSLSATNKLGF